MEQKGRKGLPEEVEVKVQLDAIKVWPLEVEVEMEASEIWEFEVIPVDHLQEAWLSEVLLEVVPLQEACSLVVLLKVLQQED